MWLRNHSAVYMCDSRISGRIWVNTAEHSSHPVGYNIYTAGCLLSPLECYMWLTLCPAVHGKARPDITHIWPDVMYIRPDMPLSSSYHSEGWREKVDECVALRLYFSGTSRKDSWTPKISQVSACLITVSVSLLLLVSVCCFFVSVFLVLVAGFGGKRREFRS